MIRLKNISKYYQTGKIRYDVLKNISLDFDDKGFISILGPSGCGKTTLVNIIGALDKQSSGDLIINGKNTKDFKANEWDSYRNNSIGFIFQKFNLINHLSVYANVELTLRLARVNKKERKKKILEALKIVGLEKMAAKKPNVLSGGEQQRVAIARAIVNNPEIILADEPTGSLDSVNSRVVINILKKLSKDKLIILITHNQELAKEYSDKIILIEDGEIKDNIIKESKKENSTSLKKVFMSFGMAFNLSIKNIYFKLIRTLFTIFAGCLAVVAISLVVSVSSGVDVYIKEVQSAALADSPIVISSRTITTQSGTVITNKQSYPDTDSIIVTTSYTNYEKINNIENDFVSYIDRMDSSYYTVLNYNRNITMRMLRKISDSYHLVSNSYFTEMVDDTDFILSQYDVIYGQFPKEYNEVCLVIDRFNCISSSVIESLCLFDINNLQEEYTYEQIVNSSYKLVFNDDYYYKENGIYKKQSSYKTLYDKCDVDLKITGIIREKRNVNGLYSPGIIYFSDLTEVVLENANNSSIVKEQKEYKLAKNVFTGKEYVEVNYGSSIDTPQYIYEKNLLSLSSVATIVKINLYSDSFENRTQIENYIKNYSYYNEFTNISYNDYMSNLTNDLTTFVAVVMKVLMILALISLLISVIMIVIITHISVVERTKEIGILRSVGARKLDIIYVFSSENIIIGFISGIIGLFLAFLFKSPINTFIINIIKDNVSQASKVNSQNIINLDFKTIIILIISSTFITFVAGFIPILFASIKKPVDTIRKE